MTSSNSHLPQRAADATNIGINTGKDERPTTYVVPATSAMTAGKQNDKTFLEDIEKQLIRGDVPFRTDDRLDHSVPKAKPRQTDIMSQSVVIPGPNIAEGHSLHEHSASLKPDVSKELPLEVPQALATFSLSGTTVDIGDLSRSTRNQSKREVQEPLNASKPHAEDILSTFDQSQLYKDVPQAAKVALIGTGSDSGQPLISRTGPGGLTSDVPKVKESGFVADKDMRKKTQQVNPSPKVPVEEVITASEMALTYKDSETESAVTPLIEYGSSTCETSQQRDRTKAEPLQDMRRPMPDNALMETSKCTSLETAAVLGTHSRVSPMHTQAEKEKHQSTDNTSAKAPPTSLALKTDIRQQHFAPTKDDKEKCEYSALQARQSMRPVPKHENPVKVDNLKQFEGKPKTTQAVRTQEKPVEHTPRTLSTHPARSSSASTNKAKALKGKDVNESLDTTERQASQSQAHLQAKESLLPVSRIEGNTHRKYIPGKPNTVGKEASRQTQLVREVEERFSTSSKRQLQADNSKNALRSPSLNKVAASLHTTLNQNVSNGVARRPSPRPGAQNVEMNSTSETTKHVSRMAPRRSTSATMAQRPGSRSLSPSKTVRSRPSSATVSTSLSTVSNRGRGKLARHADERTQSISKHSCTVTLTQTRVSREVSKNTAHKAAESKNTRPGSRVTTTASHVRNIPMDIFEERASSKGWVSCVNASNSVLNQKIPLSPSKGVFHEQGDLKTKVISQRKKTEK
ncbi:mucin-2-like isoform X2 [Ornithodoros turicata]